jgi:hypothetical protein
MPGFRVEVPVCLRPIVDEEQLNRGQLSQVQSRVGVSAGTSKRPCAFAPDLLLATECSFPIVTPPAIVSNLSDFFQSRIPDRYLNRVGGCFLRIEEEPKTIASIRPKPPEVSDSPPYS